MKLRLRYLWFTVLYLCFIAFHDGESAAQTVDGPPVQSGQATAPGAPAGPAVTQDSRPAQLAVCNKLQTPLADTAVDEMGKLMIHVVANDIFFTGGAYLLFDMGSDGKPTGSWMACVQVRHVDGLPPANPKAPYFETSVPELLGAAATCPKEAPGPLDCKGALANYLSARGLTAIGAPRISEKGTGAATALTIWVPFAVKQ